MKYFNESTTIQDVMENYLPVAIWGATRKNPKTGKPQPISADRVRKLIPKIKENDPEHVQYVESLKRYFIWKDAPDPRHKNSNGTIHVGRPRG